MKSTVASVLAVTLHTFGLGAVIWAAIGWGLGSAFSHAPITGALTGLVYQLWSCLYLRDQMWDGLQRNQLRLQLILDQM